MGDSAECQVWQRERRLTTIKASAPTYLPHREAQAALQSSPSRTGGPQLNQATGTLWRWELHPRWSRPRPTARRRAAEAAFWSKEAGLCQASPTHAGNLRVSSVPGEHQPEAPSEGGCGALPPENQLRSICLQAADRIGELYNIIHWTSAEQNKFKASNGHRLKRRDDSTAANSGTVEEIRG
ncbi:hypothetical protein MTO96_028267 [Rhipicephalus appendiculatus]